MHVSFVWGSSRHLGGDLFTRFRTSTGVHCHTTHPSPLMLPFTLLEFTTQIKKLFPDKSSGPSGITIRMLQAADADSEFRSLILLIFNDIWDSHVQPTDWQLFLIQPLCTKGHDKDKTDPVSYRDTNLKNLPKLFEGLLLVRLTTHNDLANTLTSDHLGTKPCTQKHDAIYSLLSTIQYNK